MIEIRKTEAFARWLDGLHDMQARAHIQVAVERLAAGKAGVARQLGQGVAELRIDYGAGYRVYVTKSGYDTLVLLVGGSSKPQHAGTGSQGARA
jgi:putative addiction module killer protein